MNVYTSVYPPMDDLTVCLVMFLLCHRGYSFVYTLAIGLIPPDVEKTRREKDPCSTSLVC